MRIEIVVNQRALRRWHLRLRDRIARLAPQSRIWLRFEHGDGAYPSIVNHLLALEQFLPGRSRQPLYDLVTASDEPSTSDASADVVIDLTGAQERPRRGDGARVLQPTYDGSPSELALLARLLSGGAPSLCLENSIDRSIAATALPSLEAANGLTGGLDAVYSRVITIFEQALFSPARTQQKQQIQRRVYAPTSVAKFLLRSIVHRAARAIYHLCCYSPCWRIGWRITDRQGVLETGSLAGDPWKALTGGPSKFVADPFPIEWRGKSYIFFEELDFRVGKGVICAQQVDASGPVGEPVLALEENWHLSYPFLIEHEGQLYMLPEGSASGAVSLYRCIEFPGKWECVGPLLTNIEAADATIFQHAGRFWMTSVVRDGVGGYSDSLAIHHSPTLMGRWEEHAQRPVLIDSRHARPAGAVTLHDGALWRPVQDCSIGYGKRLSLARIDVLDPERFSQTIWATLSPGQFWPGDRLHKR